MRIKRDSLSLCMVGLVVVCVGCIIVAHAAGQKTSASREHTYPPYPSTFVTACRMVKADKELNYASDMNSLTGIGEGAILAYVFHVDAMAYQDRSVKTYQDAGAFILYLITGGEKISDVTQAPPNDDKKIMNGNGVSSSYISSDRRLFNIEARGGITFNEDHPDGYFEGQGGLLSYAEMHDMISYLQARPFSLVGKEWWKVVLSDSYRLPPCKIKWTETDRYLSH